MGTSVIQRDRDYCTERELEEGGCHKFNLGFKESFPCLSRYAK
jgi:hypothetical protein